MSINRNLKDISALLQRMKIPQLLPAISEIDQGRPRSYHMTAELPYVRQQRRNYSSVNSKEYVKIYRRYNMPQNYQRPPVKSAAFNEALVVQSANYLAVKQRRDEIEAQRQAKIRARLGYFGYY